MGEGKEAYKRVKLVNGTYSSKTGIKFEIHQKLSYYIPVDSKFYVEQFFTELLTAQITKNWIDSQVLEVHFASSPLKRKSNSIRLCFVCAEIFSFMLS